MDGFADKADRFFRVSERGSTFATEIKGGLITFLSMAYVLAVNPAILHEAAADSVDGPDDSLDVGGGSGYRADGLVEIVKQPHLKDRR
ncbi:MAG: hypothetical protein IKH98_05510 [Candidatus Methanomethylophilaceae archaeon]|nr:hypothetical protein [Candidatus Methanomethylophilaceae archaeon]